MWNFLLHEEHHTIFSSFPISFFISTYDIKDPVSDKNDKSNDIPHFWQQWFGISDDKSTELFLPFSTRNDVFKIECGRDWGRERGKEGGRGRERGRGCRKGIKTEEGVESVIGREEKRGEGRGRGKEDWGRAELISVDKITFSSWTFSILFNSWREIKLFCFSNAIWKIKIKKKNKSVLQSKVVQNSVGNLRTNKTQIEHYCK